MPQNPSRNPLSSGQLTRLLRQLEDVVGEADRLRQQIARRLARTPGRQVSRLVTPRKAAALKR